MLDPGHEERAGERISEVNYVAHMDRFDYDLPSEHNSSRSSQVHYDYKSDEERLADL